MSIKNILSAAALAVAALSAHATIVQPGDMPVAVSPAFGPVSEAVTTQYVGSGLVFSNTAIFNDSPLAFGGISPAGLVDLVSPVDAYFVLPNTTIAAVTDFLSVEAGYSEVGTITLEAFDINNSLIGSTLNGAALGPHGRTLASLNLAGIHSFRISGLDTWGADQIEFGALAPAVPEPETNALLLAGLLTVGAVSVRARRRSV